MVVYIQYLEHLSELILSFPQLKTNLLLFDCHKIRKVLHILLILKNPQLFYLKCLLMNQDQKNQMLNSTSLKYYLESSMDYFCQNHY